MLALLMVRLPLLSDGWLHSDAVRTFAGLRRALKNAGVFRDRWNRGGAEHLRGPARDVRSTSVEGCSRSELEAARGHRDARAPRRRARGRRRTGAARQQKSSPNSSRSKATVAGADLVELRAQHLGRDDRVRREGPQPAVDVAVAARRASSSESATLPSASAWALSPMRAPRPGHARHALAAAGERDHDLAGVRRREVDALVRALEELVEQAAETGGQVARAVRRHDRAAPRRSRW